MWPCIWTLDLLNIEIFSYWEWWERILSAEEFPLCSKIHQQQCPSTYGTLRILLQRYSSVGKRYNLTSSSFFNVSKLREHPERCEPSSQGELTRRELSIPLSKCSICTASTPTAKSWFTLPIQFLYVILPLNLIRTHTLQVEVQYHGTYPFKTPNQQRSIKQHFAINLHSMGRVLELDWYAPISTHSGRQGGSGLAC